MADVIFLLDLIICVLEQSDGIWQGVKGLITSVGYFLAVCFFSGPYFKPGD